MTESMCLSIVGIQPRIHKQYRQAYLENKEDLWGLYAEKLPLDLALLDEVLNGRIVLEGDTDLGDYGGVPLQHPQETTDTKIPAYVEGTRQDLTRLNIRNLPLNVIKNIRTHIVKLHGSYYGHMGRVVTMAMELGLKMSKGTVRIAQESRTYTERLIRTGGDNPVLIMYSELKKEFIDFKNYIKSLGLPKLNPKRTKKVNKSTNKLNKAVSILDELKKFKETSFTEQDYKTVLIKVLGQGDNRTVKSDLELLKNAELIRTERKTGLNGIIRYYFVENKLYNEYQGEAANRNFIVKAREMLKDRMQVTRDELEQFISDITGLSDSDSVLDRLDTLELIGLIEQIEPDIPIYNVNST